MPSLPWPGTRARARAPLLEIPEEIDDLQIRLQAATSLFELDELPSAELFIRAAKERRLHYPLEWTTAGKVFVRFRTREAVSLLVLRMVKVPPPEAAGYGKNLELLTGERFGDDPARWYRWLEKNRASLPPQIE